MPDPSRHLIGLLLGAEEDWPQAFEAILRRVGPVTDGSGTVHEVTSERLTIEPFELTDPVRADLVIDRLAYWYYHPREWLKKAALMNREVEKGRPLDEAESQQVIVSLIKQRRDSIEQFTKGAREDLAAREAAEITILEPYLPPPVDAGDVEREIDAAIAESGATQLKDMGRVMAALKAAHGAALDLGRAGPLVRTRLSA